MGQGRGGPQFTFLATPLVQPPPPYDSSSALHGRTTFQKPTTTLSYHRHDWLVLFPGVLAGSLAWYIELAPRSVVANGAFCLSFYTQPVARPC